MILRKILYYKKKNDSKNIRKVCLFLVYAPSVFIPATNRVKGYKNFVSTENVHM